MVPAAAFSETLFVDSVTSVGASFTLVTVTTRFFSNESAPASVTRTLMTWFVAVSKSSSVASATWSSSPTSWNRPPPRVVH